MHGSFVEYSQRLSISSTSEIPLAKFTWFSKLFNQCHVYCWNFSTISVPNKNYGLF